MLKKGLNIAFWLVFGVIFVIWLVDFILVKSEKDPVFCLSKETITVDGGTAKKCSGLGYKVFEYNSETIGKGYEFGPFWLKVREK